MFLQKLACWCLDLWLSVLFAWFVSCLCLKCRVFLLYILSSKTHKPLTLTSVCCLSQDYAATGSCFYLFHPGSRVETLSSHETFSLPKCSRQPEKSTLCCTHDQVSYRYSAIANRWSYCSVQWHGTTCKKKT